MDLTTILVDGVRQAIGPSAVVLCISAIGLNIHFGYTGLLNFGQVAFMLVGGLGVASMARPCADEAARQVGGGTFPCGQPLVLAILLAIVLAVGLALLLGIPTLRLRADYLAITTIAAGEILRVVTNSNVMRSVTNASFGLSEYNDDFRAVNPIPGGRYLGDLSYGSTQVWTMVVGWTLVVLLSLWVYALMRSPWGRVLKSIREDEDAARALGKNVFLYKMQALILGGVFGALGGILLVLERGSTAPGNFIPIVTFNMYVALIIGGPGTVLGPIVGTMIFLFLISAFDTFVGQAIIEAGETFGSGGFIPAALLDPSQTGPVRFIMVGLMLVLLMVFRPQGIFGNREEMLLDAR
jgi:neutral amino acid transport system permease protein